MESEIICFCSNISKLDIVNAINKGAKTLQDIREQTKACTVGKCRELSPTKKCCSGKIVEILNEYSIIKSNINK